MKDFQKDIIIEEAELKIKIDEMIGFISSDEFCHIDEIDKILMKSQLHYMRKYLKILRKRIKNFKFD